jgi:hypothetical protein
MMPHNARRVIAVVKCASSNFEYLRMVSNLPERRERPRLIELLGRYGPTPSRPREVRGREFYSEVGHPEVGRAQDDQPDEPEED